MEAELKWLDDPEVFRVNQLPAHSDHRFYRDQEEAALEKSSYVQNLNGAPRRLLQAWFWS